jgi:carbon storage regulator CsrA
MLVLTRNTQESILIHTLDGIIEVVVTQAKNGKAKLGVIAPPEVLVMRQEINELNIYEQSR